MNLNFICIHTYVTSFFSLDEYDTGKRKKQEGVSLSQKSEGSTSRKVWFGLGSSQKSGSGAGPAGDENGSGTGFYIEIMSLNFILYMILFTLLEHISN